MATHARGRRGSGRRRLRELTCSVVDTMEILEEVRGKHSGVGGMSKALVQVRLYVVPARFVFLFNTGDTAVWCTEYILLLVCVYVYYRELLCVCTDSCTFYLTAGVDK